MARVIAGRGILWAHGVCQRRLIFKLLTALL